MIGAGPIGLAAAARLIERDIQPLVLEAGPAAATAVRAWSHVRLFSPWSEVVDPAAEKLLAPTGWVRPDGSAYPSGADWAGLYLQPLADVLGEKVRYDTTVTGVSRAGRDRIVDADRDTQPFVIRYTGPDGAEGRIHARAVIDASGTWSTPGPAGGSGLPAIGEKAAADRISYRIPDLKNPAVRARYAGKRTAVIGSGASAFTALACLADLATSDGGAGTHATWILRRGISGSTFGGGEADQLPARGALGLAAKAAVEDGYADAITGFRTDAVERDGDGRLVLIGEDNRRLAAVDEVVALTGLRPDLTFLEELRLGLDERLRGAHRARAADRPQPALVRHRLPARRGRAVPPREGPLPRRHEVVRPRPDLPRDDRLRAGPLHRRPPRRRPRGRRTRRAHAPGDRCLRRRGPLRPA
ncbi:hypothetical protein GCM10020254_85030 [Streptomyces goshikiensis]